MVGVAADQGEEKLEEAWNQENAVYLEDKPVIDKIAPRWSEAGGRQQVHTLADAWPLAVRGRFDEWVRNAANATGTS